MLLRIAPLSVLILMLLPIVGGLLGTLLPAFGYLPALGATTPSLQPWQAVLAWPGLGKALGLSLWTGLAASLASFLLAQFALAMLIGSRWLTRLSALTAPVIAIPHAAMAVGLVFLIAPSGWLMRLMSPGLTGFQRPPDWLIIGDARGLSLILGLVIKELPYLIFMSLAALSQLPAERSLMVARSLGHTRLSAWFRVLLPQLYPHLRLPLMAVLAFSLSVVDMALILGPNTPPTLAAQVLRWFSDPDLSLRLQASAGASLLSLVMLACLLVWRAAERLVARSARPFLSWGAHPPRRGGRLLERLTAVPALALIALGTLALLPLLVWSLARRWRFPHAWPSRWSLERWQSQGEALGTAWANTLLLAGLATVLAVLLVLLSLEKEARFGRRLSGQGTALLKYLPLLVPQTSFLFGFQVLALALGLSDGALGRWALVVWAHLLYVLPYGFISLSLAYQRFDPRLVQTAQSLGRGPWRIFWAIKLPLLSPAIWAAVAIGVAVSVTQYLPTLLLAGGRIETLATETVGRSAGGDRRVLAVFALCQAALPFGALMLASLAPRLIFWNRKGVWS